MTGRWALAALLLVGLFIVKTPPAHAKQPVPLTRQEAERKQALLQLLRQEDEAILRGDTKKLRDVFLPGSETAQAAFRHAKARSAFLAAWSRTRHLRFRAIAVGLRTPGVRPVGPTTTRIYGIVSETLTYGRENNPSQQTWTFGLGVRHQFLLEKGEDRWFIRSDDFTDPLDQDTRVPGTAVPTQGADAGIRDLPTPARHPVSRGAQAAVAYADSYCGSAPGCGHGGGYHPHYGDFNGAGGDCTNFVSQVLQSGGFRQNGSWSFDTAKGSGTRAWLNAEGLLDYLRWSGRASVFARGTFRQVTSPRPGIPGGKVSKLRPGDLVGYFEKGHVVHFGVVTGFGPGGYPLVNGHTGDRYRVPWDIGWDRNAVFYLLHVHYPKKVSRR